MTFHLQKQHYYSTKATKFHLRLTPPFLLFYSIFFLISADVDECGGHSRQKRLAWWPQILSSSPTLTSGKL